ncbi:hypothetical protein VTK73DRAFT_7406 [Phialemonium thermophilum]|uniref:Small acidic protein-like domain-containing protein n=1 Tax=Phialemonium thermophilum TaxID=223376 RepID=A0ABR3XTS2_9PEZI
MDITSEDLSQSLGSRRKAKVKNTKRKDKSSEDRLGNRSPRPDHTSSTNTIPKSLSQPDGPGEPDILVKKEKKQKKKKHKHSSLSPPECRLEGEPPEPPRKESKHHKAKKAGRGSFKSEDPQSTELPSDDVSMGGLEEEAVARKETKKDTKRKREDDDNRGNCESKHNKKTKKGHKKRNSKSDDKPVEEPNGKVELSTSEEPAQLEDIAPMKKTTREGNGAQRSKEKKTKNSDETDKKRNRRRKETEKPGEITGAHVTEHDDKYEGRSIREEGEMKEKKEVERGKKEETKKKKEKEKEMKEKRKEKMKKEKKEETVKTEPSSETVKTKESKTGENPALRERWNVQDLGGGPKRQDKFMRLLGGKKHPALTSSATEGGGQHSTLDMGHVAKDLQRQFEAGIRMKFEAGGQRKGLGC